jgi:VWFA-related protein
MKRSITLLVLVALWAVPAQRTRAQERGPRFRVTVDLVQLNVAVTDNKGNYVNGLKPKDFVVVEDGIQQKVATFGVGNEPARSVAEIETGNGVAPIGPAANMFADANVFILFDKSNYMYRGFVFAQDSIAEFVRSLEGPNKVAFYSYSRDLSRDAALTPDRLEVLKGVRATTAGDNAALYNALLLTLKDARNITGRKVVVVFSNGPDNTSVVAPEDVSELAQSEGVPIYMISTREARHDPVSSAVFERMSAATGGKAYFARTWRDQRQAFASIREDLAHLYSLSYYPQPNPNRGWRAITVKLTGEAAKKYKVRTRSGYRPLPNRAPAEHEAATDR